MSGDVMRRRRHVIWISPTTAATASIDCLNNTRLYKSQSVSLNAPFRAFPPAQTPAIPVLNPRPGPAVSQHNAQNVPVAVAVAVNDPNGRHNPTKGPSSHLPPFRLNAT